MAQWIIKKGTDYIIIFVFFLIIILPLLDNYFVIDLTPNIDNREMKELPAAPHKFSELPKFFDEFDLYYRDQYGFRNSLIRWYNLLYYKIFGQSGNGQVVVGKKSWLYYAAENSIDDYRKVIKLSQRALEAWKYILESRQKWCQDRNIDYLFVVAPSKHSVYPEYMPDWIKSVGPSSAMDQLVLYLKDNSNISILDLRPSLLASKKKGNLYYTGDSHWNTEGSYLAYQSIMTQLSKKNRYLKPYAKNDFEFLKIGSRTQDLALMLNLNPAYRLFDYKVKLRGREDVSMSSDNIERSKYSKKEGPFSTSSADGVINAVFFRDSFLKFLIPYLAVHFNRAVYYWQSEFDPHVVEVEKPQVVIHEVAERFISRESSIFEKKYDWAKKTGRYNRSAQARPNNK